MSVRLGHWVHAVGVMGTLVKGTHLLNVIIRTAGSAWMVMVQMAGECAHLTLAQGVVLETHASRLRNTGDKRASVPLPAA